MLFFGKNKGKKGADAAKDTARTFILTDGCMWEQNKKQGAFHPHAIEVVDAETGQVRYIQSGARIRFVEGLISDGRNQEQYNEATKPQA